MISDEKRGDITAYLSRKVVVKLRRQFAIVAQEVWVDPEHRVDFVAFSPGAGGRNCALEHGKFVFVEVKSCMDDFKSGHGLTFHGDQNWLVCPRDLAHKLYDERLLPFGVQVYCPDGGGSLRLTYDLQMQAVKKSLREDSTLCLLWSMLTGSYSAWRKTVPVFSERSKEMSSGVRDTCGRSRGDAAQAIGDVIGALCYHERQMTSVPPKVASQLAERLERAVGEL